MNICRERAGGTRPRGRLERGRAQARGGSASRGSSRGKDTDDGRSSSRGGTRVPNYVWSNAVDIEDIYGGGGSDKSASSSAAGKKKKKRPRLRSAPPRRSGGGGGGGAGGGGGGGGGGKNAPSLGSHGAGYLLSTATDEKVKQIESVYSFGKGSIGGRPVPRAHKHGHRRVQSATRARRERTGL